MALTEIDRTITAGVRFGCALADAGYGLSAPFRQGLTASKLAWAVGIPRHLKVDILSIPAEDMLANAKWRTISWRTGTKGKPRFAAVRVRVADGPPQRIRDKGQQHLPGDDALTGTTALCNWPDHPHIGRVQRKSVFAGRLAR